MTEIPHGELQSLNPSQIVELYELSQFNPADLSQTIYFTNERIPVTWQGITYQPVPVESSGWEYKGSGTLPRPTMRVSNIGSIVSHITRPYNDLIGAKLVRRRTLAKYLDDQPTASDAEFQPEVYYVQRKVGENNVAIEFELNSVFDLEGMKIPRRRMLSNICLWRYRGPECGYTGGPVADIWDNPTTDPNNDRCGKRLDSCKLRFGANSELPFGGFPGLRKLGGL